MDKVDSKWSNRKEDDNLPLAWITIGMSLLVIALIQVYTFFRQFETPDLPTTEHLASFDRVEDIEIPHDFFDEAVIHVENIGETYDRDDLEVQQILNQRNVRPHFEPEHVRQFHNNNEGEDAVVNEGNGRPRFHPEFLRDLLNENANYEGNIGRPWMDPEFRRHFHNEEANFNEGVERPWFEPEFMRLIRNEEEESIEELPIHGVQYEQYPVNFEN